LHVRIISYIWIAHFYLFPQFSPILYNIFIVSRFTFFFSDNAFTWWLSSKFAAYLNAKSNSHRTRCRIRSVFVCRRSRWRRASSAAVLTPWIPSVLSEGHRNCNSTFSVFPYIRISYFRISCHETRYLFQCNITNGAYNQRLFSSDI